MSTTTMNFPLVEASMLIGGERVSDPRRLEVWNPARPEELVGTVVRGTPDDADQAVAAARAAQPAWGEKSYRERAEVLGRALVGLDQDLEYRAALFVRENGKTLSEARSELSAVVGRQRLLLELAPDLDHHKTLSAANGRTVIGHRPYGVVLSIVPWNSPVSLGFSQIISALFSGNGVVVKPPETCPLSLIRAIEALAEGLPPGLINIVTGLPLEIGDALTAHPHVGKIGFTGSIPSARRIAANAAQSIKSLTLELGGNDPAILLDDADLGESSMERLAQAVFRMTGQVCMAVKRIYVPEAISAPFLNAFTQTVDRIVVGDGLRPNVTMGPMHTRQALEKAHQIVADAEERGAAVSRLGQVRDSTEFEHGHFMRPTIVTHIADDVRLVAEEQFCPAIPILTYTHVDDALTRANATVYGLGGSVWSRNVDRAFQLAQRIEAGTVFVNTHGVGAVNRRAPYGGIKQSGLGRKSAIEGLFEYVQFQTLTTHEEPGTSPKI